tara:strand:- start:2013 stop:3890 length:1878 start_codon:yes stop_codon:yes gene_type:complete
MPLTKLQFKPGINTETTSYANEGGWFDGDKIRFRFGVPEKIGGWQKLSGSTFLGTARAIKPFVALDSTRYNGLGTNLKYYIEEGGGYNDITPIRATTAAGDVTFAATNGSSTLTVTDNSHGAIVNDFVTFSGAATLGGTITADVLNQEYQVVSVPTANSFTVTAKDTSGATVTANASDSGNGGGSVVGAYQINVGLNTTVSGSGWGAGTWGRGTWDSASSLLAAGATLRLWGNDNFGEDLLFNVRDGGIYYWDKSGGLIRAVALDSLGTDATIPTIAKQVMVSDRDRHVIAFGCDGEASIGTQDPMLIRFSDQGSLSTWQSTAENTAGELSLGSGSEIVTAIETRQQILVLTDVSAYSMQFLGPPFTFGINLISENITIMAPNAAKAVDDMVFWMGQDDFYMYNGQVQKMPCSIKSYIFNDFNSTQSEKVSAGLNSSFNEIWWFYPSSSSDENDRYAIYNYVEQVWYYGVLARTVWIDRGINTQPLAAGTDNFLYNQELGLDDGSTAPHSAITAYITSSQLDLGDGESFAFIRRIIPDVTFDGSTSDAPAANFIIKTRNFPGGTYNATSTNAVTRSATVPVEQFTTQAHVRLRGRSFTFELQSTIAETQWRLGAPRVEVRPDGRR